MLCFFEGSKFSRKEAASRPVGWRLKTDPSQWSTLETKHQKGLKEIKMRKTVGSSSRSYWPSTLWSSSFWRGWLWRWLRHGGWRMENASKIQERNMSLEDQLQMRSFWVLRGRPWSMPQSQAQKTSWVTMMNQNLAFAKGGARGWWMQVQWTSQWSSPLLESDITPLRNVHGYARPSASWRVRGAPAVESCILKGQMNQRLYFHMSGSTDQAESCIWIMPAKTALGSNALGINNAKSAWLRVWCFRFCQRVQLGIHWCTTSPMSSGWKKKRTRSCLQLIHFCSIFNVYIYIYTFFCSQFYYKYIQIG